MRAALRVLAVLTLLLLSPDLLLMARSPDMAFAAGVMLQSLLLWCFLVVACGRARVLLVVALVPLMVLPVELFFIGTYGYPTTRHVLALMVETTPEEASAYLSGLLPWLLGSLVALLALWIVLWRAAPRQRMVSRTWQVAALVALLAVSVGHDALRRVPGMPLAVQQFSWANAYPAGLVYRVAGWWRYQRQGEQAREQIARHHFGARTSEAAMTVVFVIGESARPDHWQLGGYGRATSPQLAARGDVVFLPDLVTPWDLTRYSVPVLMTRKDATDTAVLPEQSLLGAFREAGYDTWWFANQQGLDEVSAHMAEAAHRQVYNLSVGRGDVDAAFDGAMLPDIDAALAQPGGRKLLAIHTKGSHWDYNLRYPREFARFMPDTLPPGAGKYSASNRETLVNSYDNSLLYTDDFLARLIARLQARGGPAALVYVSDHGEGLYDGGCEMFGHGNDLEIAFRTAALVWVSPDWARQHPGQAEALHANARLPLGTAGTVFHTVSDLGGLNIADPAKSLLQPGRRADTRIANVSAGALDFDHSARRGACRFIAKEAP